MKRRHFIQLASSGLAAACLPGCATKLEKTLTTKATDDRELLQLDGLATAALVNKGDISPRELLLATVKRIATLDDKIGAISVLDFDAALARADNINRSAPFAGLPLLLKDGTDFGTLSRPHGSRLFANYKSKGESPIIKRYIELGFNVIGYSKTPEFNNLTSTEPLYQGPCRNPWNLKRSAGGSTGGGAAAVAAGYLPIAHGTDGGGSLRIPASFCGVFGFKPSQYRMLSGFLNGSNNSFTQHHALSRSVRDSATLLALTQDPNNNKGLAPLDLVTRPIGQRQRIGLLETNLFNQASQGNTRKAMEYTAKVLINLGHEITPLKLDFDGDEFFHHYLSIFGLKLSALIKYVEQQTGKRAEDTGLLEPWTISLARRISSRGADAVKNANAYISKLKQQIDQQMKKSHVDILLSPVTAGDAPELGVIQANIDYETLYKRNTAMMSYTCVQNMVEMTAMSVPLYWGEDDMPVGSHFSARPGEENRLFALALELEQANGWRHRWAPHSAQHS